MAAEKELQSVAKIPQTSRQQKQIAIQARPVEDNGLVSAAGWSGTRKRHRAPLPRTLATGVV
jgi:hypothetical protein